MCLGANSCLPLVCTSIRSRNEKSRVKPWSLLSRSFEAVAQFAFLLVLCVASGAVAQEKAAARARDLGPATFVNEYFEKLRQEKKSVFQSQCALRSGGIARLIFPIGQAGGIFIGSGAAVNTATVIWRDGEWQTDDAMGGIYTLKRVNGIIQQLLSSPFRIIAADGLKGAETSAKSRPACREVS